MPCLYYQDHIYTSHEAIQLITSTKGLMINSFLNQSQLVTCNAFISLVESKLNFALDYELFYDSKTFKNLVLPLRGEVYPWPLNYIIPWQERNQKIAEMLAKNHINTQQVILFYIDLCRCNTLFG